MPDDLDLPAERPCRFCGSLPLDPQWGRLVHSLLAQVKDLEAECARLRERVAGLERPGCGEREMVPTPDDRARDLNADLVLCEAATPGPWDLLDSRKESWHFTAPDGTRTPEGAVEWQILGGQAEGLSTDYGWQVMGGRHGAGTIHPERADLLLAAAAREGWPAAIRRALSAEAVCAGLRARVAELEAAAAPPCAHDWVELQTIPGSGRRCRLCGLTEGY